MKGVIFTFALTYGGAVVSLFNPYIGLLIYICFAIIKPTSLWFYSLPPGNYSRIIAIALLVGWLLKGLGSWHLGKATGIVYALLAFAAWSALSAIQAANQNAAWAFVEELAKIVLPFLVGITTIDSIAKLRGLAWVIVVSQGFIAYELNVSYYEGFNRLADYGFGGMDNNCVAIALDSCIGLAFFLGLYSERWWQKLLAFGAMMLMAHAVLFSFSRGGMLGLIATGLACFVLIPKKPFHYAMLMGVVLAVLRLAGPQVQERFFSSFVDEKERDASADSRLKLWQDCIDVAVKNPILGVGPNHWRLIAHTYGWPAGKSGHTLWLEVMAELGFPGLLWLVLFYGLCMVRVAGLMRLSESLADPWPYHMACMVIASLAGFAVSAQFVSLVGLEAPYYVTLLGAGLLKLSSVSVETPAPDDADGTHSWELDSVAGLHQEA